MNRSVGLLSVFSAESPFSAASPSSVAPPFSALAISARSCGSSVALTLMSTSAEDRGITSSWLGLTTYLRGGQSGRSRARERGRSRTASDSSS